MLKKIFLKILKVLMLMFFVCRKPKAQCDQVEEVLKDIDGYFVYSNSAEKKGYSGTAVISKVEPISVSKGIGIEEHDNEGRVLTVEYDQFYLVNVICAKLRQRLKAFRVSPEMG